MIMESPIEKHQWLEQAKENQWLLTTSEIKAIIGVRPKTKKNVNIFVRGNWVFLKKGKIGNEIAWMVKKVSLSETESVFPRTRI